MQRRLFQEVLNSSSNWKAIYEQPCTSSPLFRNDVSLSHTCQGRVQHSRIRYVQIIIHPTEYPTASALCKQMISLGQTGVRSGFEALMNRKILKPALKGKNLKLQHCGNIPLFNPFHAHTKLSFTQAPLKHSAIPWGAALPRALRMPRLHLMQDHCQMPLIDRGGVNSHCPCFAHQFFYLTNCTTPPQSCYWGQGTMFIINKL